MVLENSGSAQPPARASGSVYVHAVLVGKAKHLREYGDLCPDYRLIYKFRCLAAANRSHVGCR